MSADRDVTAQAGPAPSAGNTAGQAQLAALGHAGLAAETAKKESKKKISMSGMDPGSEYARVSLPSTQQVIVYQRGNYKNSALKINDMGQR